MSAIRLLALAAGATLLSTAAYALDSDVSMTSKLSANELWQKVGDFCAIGQWHPAIQSCKLSEDGKQRTLALKGGGTIVEHLELRDDQARTYTYTILSSPLPVTDYRSTIRVTPEGAGSVINWIGHYDAKGAPDADAKGVIDGIYQAGELALVGG